MDELNVDLATNYERDAKVIVRTRIDFASPFAVHYTGISENPGAPGHDFAVIWHGKTTAPSGDSKVAA